MGYLAAISVTCLVGGIVLDSIALCLVAVIVAIIAIRGSSV